MTKFNFLWLIYRSLANGRLIAAKHLVITNSSNTRHNVVYFVNPTKESLIEPAKPLISLTSPVFRSMTFGVIFFIKGSQFEEELLLINSQKTMEKEWNPCRHIFMTIQIYIVLEKMKFMQCPTIWTI